MLLMDEWSNRPAMCPLSPAQVRWTNNGFVGHHLGLLDSRLGRTVQESLGNNRSVLVTTYFMILVQN